MSFVSDCGITAVCNALPGPRAEGIRPLGKELATVRASRMPVHPASQQPERAHPPLTGVPSPLW